MEIKLLPKSVRETLRAEINIRSFAKCISQLVLNSLDAKASSIAIRINLTTFKIQIIDSGIGISKKNLKLIGFRYATNKYYSAEDLKKNSYLFPSRGETLASIIQLSKSVKIISRYSNCPKTYSKTFENGKYLQISKCKQRPSKGTTIIVENFLYNVPVRKKLINKNICFDEIKNEIEYIALINTAVSFSIRNDTTGEIMFQTYRTKFVFQTATLLYGKEFSRWLRKFCYKVDNYSISGLISLNSYPQNIRQYIYINNRIVFKTNIHILVNSLISKSLIIKNQKSLTLNEKYSAFIINIKCPYNEIDIIDYINLQIEFKNWEKLSIYIKNGIIEFLKSHNLINLEDTEDKYQTGSPLIQSLPKIRTSQVHGVIRGIPMKRKVENENLEITKMSKKHENLQELNKVWLESNSEKGKTIIMDMFLKSTTVFRNEVQNNIQSASEQTSKTSTCLISALQTNINQITSAKISITKTIEHKLTHKINHNDATFKIPKIPKPKINLKTFELDFLNNISKLFANQTQNFQYNIAMQKNYMRAIDFLKPAMKKTNFQNKIQFDFRNNCGEFSNNKYNVNTFSSCFKKEFLESNTVKEMSPLPIYNIQRSNHSNVPKNIDYNHVFKTKFHQNNLFYKYNFDFDKNNFKNRLKINTISENVSFSSGPFCQNNKYNIKQYPNCNNESKNNFLKSFPMLENIKTVKNLKKNSPKTPEIFSKKNFNAKKINNNKYYSNENIFKWIQNSKKKLSSNTSNSKTNDDIIENSQESVEIYLKKKLQNIGNIKEKNNILLNSPPIFSNSNCVQTKEGNEVSETIENISMTTEKLPTLEIKNTNKQEKQNNTEFNLSPLSNILKESEVNNILNNLNKTIVSEKTKLPDVLKIIIPSNTNKNTINDTKTTNIENNKDSNQIITCETNENIMLDWVKQTSEFGNSYYMNTRTGMTSFLSPRNMVGCQITKRSSFLPKGMSPILFSSSTAISKELTPKSRNILYQTIAYTENDELHTVKWMNYLENNDAKQFFNNLYCDKKYYETEIPHVKKLMLPKKILAGLESYSFSKNDFKNVTVINQYDNKFIVTKIEKAGNLNLLVLFDQHAVHERIRLEKLLKDYEEEKNKLKSTKCKNAVTVILNEFEIKMLQNYKKNFENWGFVYEITKNFSVVFTKIPLCWQWKDDSDQNKDCSTTETLIMSLIQEEYNWLKNIKKINIAVPQIIQNVIKMEACRTAIKFGHPLSKKQCEAFIKELLLCDLPFNCAHGRPTLIPIFDLKNFEEFEEEKFSFVALKC